MFTVFFIATLFAEFTGSYRAYIGKNNLFIYNFFSVIEFLFYLYFISIVIRNNTAKKILQISMPLYALIAVANILFVQGMKKLHTITYSFGCLMIVTACIYYFFELFRNPKSVKLSADPAFWICSGLLFFYCCSFPLFAFLNFWGHFKWMADNFETIITILNIFLYSLFSIAFLCNRTPKYISSSS